MNKNNRIIILNQEDVIGSSIYHKLLFNKYNIIESKGLNYKNDNELKEFIFATKPEYCFITNIEEEYEQKLINHLINIRCKKIINYLNIDSIPNYTKTQEQSLITILIDEVYGDNDNYNFETCSVFATMLRQIHESNIYNNPIIYLQIDNNRKRNFIHSDDLANATINIMDNFDTNQIIDLRTGSNLNLKCLADLIKEYLNCTGDIIFFDENKCPYKNIKYNRVVKKMDWIPKITIKQGIRKTHSKLIDVNKYFIISSIF
jgi:ribosomal protein L24E